MTIFVPLSIIQFYQRALWESLGTDCLTCALLHLAGVSPNEGPLLVIPLFGHSLRHGLLKRQICFSQYWIVSTSFELGSTLSIGHKILSKHCFSELSVQFAAHRRSRHLLSLSLASSESAEVVSLAGFQVKSLCMHVGFAIVCVDQWMRKPMLVFCESCVG